MSALAAQLQFAAELVLFVAAASGLASLALTGAPPGAGRDGDGGIGLGGRTALAGGLVCLGAAAFLHGSQVVADGDSPAVVVLRVLGVVLAAVGSLSWAVGSVPALLLRGGLVLVAAAVGADLAGAHNGSAGLLAAGGLALGVAVVSASSRSIAARVAASAAVSLLIVVLILGVALSAVLVSTVRDGALDRLDQRVFNEATTASQSFAGRLEDAKLVAGSFEGTPDRLTVLRRLTTTTGSSDVLSADLAVLSRSFLSDVALTYVTRSGTVQGVAPGSVRLDNATVVGLPQSDVVSQALARSAPRGSVAVLGGQALAIGAQPVLDRGRAGEVLGVAVAVSELDATYLAVASADDGQLSLALAGRSDLLTRRGDQPAFDRIRSAVADALDEGRRQSAEVGDRFVAVAPVESADGRAVLAMVASTPTTLVDDTRASIFRNLFRIALGGTLLALIFAAFVGNRIGARLRRLTAAVRAIEQGDLSVRTAGPAGGPGSGVGSDVDDEVGILGRSFDSMAASVQEKTVAESALRERLEAVVGGMGEALVAVDGSGRVTDFNQAAEQLLGVPASRARGSSFGDVASLHDVDGAALLLPRPGSPQRWSTQGWVRRDNGTEVPVAVSAGPVRGPGTDAGGTVFVLRDLRREREVEQMKTEFLSRIGHELRTPLTGIIGYADLLNRKRVPAERAALWHGEILTQSKGLLRIVEMLEFFASAGAGRMSLHLETVDAGAMVDEAARRWRVRLGRPRALRRRVASKLPMVHADARLLAACLDELIDNAFKFSPKGVAVEVGAAPVEGRIAGRDERRAEASAPWVELSVTDRGQGMTAEQESRAFAEFAQGDASDTRAHGGLGLGLSFVKRVVEAHGGRLVCETEQQKGSKFSILLPAGPIEDVG